MSDYLLQLPVSVSMSSDLDLESINVYSNREKKTILCKVPVIKFSKSWDVLVEKSFPD